MALVLTKPTSKRKFEQAKFSALARIAPAEEPIQHLGISQQVEVARQQSFQLVYTLLHSSVCLTSVDLDQSIH